MLRLRDIMTREVLTVAPDLTLRDCLSVFATRHISGAPVVTGGKVVGVVSLTDIAEFAAVSPGVPTERPDFVEWCEWEEPQEALDGEEPPSAFFAELWDDAGADASTRMQHPANPEWNDLEEHTVSEVMNRRVCALAPEAGVESAAAYMRDAGIHRVLVMEGERLEGIVSRSDVAGAVADRRIAHRVYVFPRPSGPAARRP